MSFLRKHTRLLTGAALFTITLYLIHSYHRHTSQAPKADPKTDPILEILEWQPNAPPRIAIAATSSPNTNTRSIALWQAYASRFGHELLVQHIPAVRGFANPLIWLHHVIASELMKDTSNKADWIVFIDPSTILPSNRNNSLAHFLPPSHFLPPPTFPSYPSLTFIGTNSKATLHSHDISVDTSLFYIRVSSLSLRILTLAMAAVYLDPGRNWGEDVAGAALREVLGREGYRDKVAWIPEGWFGARDAGFVKMDWREGGLGLLEREKVLAEVEQGMRQGRREAVPSKKEVEAFWKLVGEARSVLDAANDKKDEAGEEMEELRDVVELRTWDIRALIGAIERLKERLGYRELMRFKDVVG